MRKSRIILAVAAIVMLFTGCSSEQTAGNNIPSTETVSEFALIETPFNSDSFTSRHCRIYRDPVTDVMYMSFKGWTSGGLAWMPDPDSGLPLKYDRFLELYAEYIPTEKIQEENANE